MWFAIKLYLRDRWLLVTSLVSLLIQLFLWTYLLIFIPPNSESVFLHYTVSVGIDLIGPAWQVYALPAGGALMIVVNYVVGFFTFNQGRFVARLLGVATVILQILLVVAEVFIVSLNK